MAKEVNSGDRCGTTGTCRDGKRCRAESKTWKGGAEPVPDVRSHGRNKVVYQPNKDVPSLGMVSILSIMRATSAEAEARMLPGDLDCSLGMAPGAAPVCCSTALLLRAAQATRFGRRYLQGVWGRQD
jgi:hypothetical protein